MTAFLVNTHTQAESLVRSLKQAAEDMCFNQEEAVSTQNGGPIKLRAMSVRQWSGRLGFNPRLSHTKDSKIVLDSALLSTQHYKVRINGKVEQSKEWSSAHHGVVAIEKGAFGLSSTTVANFTLYIYKLNIL